MRALIEFGFFFFFFVRPVRCVLLACSLVLLVDVFVFVFVFTVASEVRKLLSFSLNLDFFFFFFRPVRCDFLAVRCVLLAGPARRCLRLRLRLDDGVRG